MEGTIEHFVQYMPTCAEGLPANLNSATNLRRRAAAQLFFAHQTALD